MRLRSYPRYLQRIVHSYLLPGHSQLTFWHEVPEVNRAFTRGQLGEYYMPFKTKATYSAGLDEDGIPILNYHGKLGWQYNPIAIAQFGLGNFNLYKQRGDQSFLATATRAADWLVSNLEPNTSGVPVWHHLFDWEYRETLRAPWYSGLAQGQGISLLVRVSEESGQGRYLSAASRAMESLMRDVTEGGVTVKDENGDLWIEEYLVSQPTHILNGLMWALWGVWDFFLTTKSVEAVTLFEQCTYTLKKNLHRYDTGFWSLYELSGKHLKMIASPFYHRLHIVQLRVMEELTEDAIFGEYADRWERYSTRAINRRRAMAQKILFKAIYY